MGGLWMSVIWVISLTFKPSLDLPSSGSTTKQLQDESLSDYLGMIVTHGFTQGPGQAIALGNLWESSYDVSLATDFGLIYASLGFVAAFLVGVPVARWAMERELHAQPSAAG